jgi:hypothetical protein
MPGNFRAAITTERHTMAAEKIKPTNKPTKPTKTQLIKMRTQKGLTEREISTLTGVPKTTIHSQLQELANSDEFRQFQTNKDKIFEGLQLKLINLADHDSLKPMLSKRGMTDVAILQDKIQLLRGEATSIQAVDIRGLIGCVIKNQESPKVEGSEDQSNIIDVDMCNK